MSASGQATEAAGGFLWALATARQSANLYPEGHPERGRLGESLLAHVVDLQGLVDDGRPTLLIDRGSFYLGGTLLPKESLALGRLAEDIEQAGIESFTLTPDVSASDLDALLGVLAGHLPHGGRIGGVLINAVRFKHRDRDPWEQRLAEQRRTYARGVSEIREASARAQAGEAIEIESAISVVNQLHDDVSRDPGYGLLLSAVKSYDEYTYFHMVNVCLLSVALGQLIGLRRDQITVLGLGGLLHDIGKVFVPADVLTEAGRLDEEQWRLIQRHPIDGAAMLFTSGAGLYHPASAILLEHHAAYDRSGYPPLHDHGPSAPSRLVAVADCFDAVTSKRTYRQPLDRHRALELLSSAAGSGLDPNAVAAFRRLLGRFPIGSLVRLSDGQVGVVVRQNTTDPHRPTVLLLFDETDTPRHVEERDLAAEGEGAPRVVRRLDPDAYGVDLPRFVATGTLQPGGAEPEGGGLIHEPSPGEPVPEGYVDTHAEAHHHPMPGTRPDPDVAPPFED